MEWWVAVLDRLQQPTWATDVGLPTTISLAALAAAVLLVRVQMRGDRQMVERARRVTAAETAGRAAREAFLLRREEPIGDGKLSRTYYADVASTVDRVTRDAEIVCGASPIFVKLRDLADDLDHRGMLLDQWRKANEYSIKPGLAAIRLYGEPRNLGLELSAFLISWDGVAPLDLEPEAFADWKKTDELKLNDEKAWDALMLERYRINYRRKHQYEGMTMGQIRALQPQRWHQRGLWQITKRRRASGR